MSECVCVRERESVCVCVCVRERVLPLNLVIKKKSVKVLDPLKL